MFGWFSTRGQRRKAADVRARNGSARRAGLRGRILSWPAAAGAVFVGGAIAITLFGETKLDYVVGQRLEQPIYAKVEFQVPDPKRNLADRRAQRAKTPSRYVINPPALTYGRIRTDLLRLYQIAADSDTYEAFEAALSGFRWRADRRAYDRLRKLVEQPDDAGRDQFQEWVSKLPLEDRHVAKSWTNEQRDPPSQADVIVLESKSEKGEAIVTQIAHTELASQESDMALQGIANYIARKIPLYELWPIVEDIIGRVFREQPTLILDQPATAAAMKAAEDATPVAMTTYEKNKPFISPGILTGEAYELLKIHESAYLQFLDGSTPEAAELQRERLLERCGLVTLVLLVSLGMLGYGRAYQRPLFGGAEHAIPCVGLALATLAAVQLLDMYWPQYPELLFVPTLMAASIYAIVFPTRFAMGLGCVLAVLVTLVAQAHLPFLLTLLTGVVVAAYQLDEIRTRTKLPRVGAVTALAVMAASAAGGLVEGHTAKLVLERALLSGVVTFGAAGVISMLLPFIERVFQTATSLTLLEWRDPTRPLLQLVAREAPGTYSHSLVLGTLAEAACERIGANSLLAQVGALYHDVGKIHRPSYFTENQEGRINRHDNLAPSMSLLIILGHVKDGLELARQYKLPRTLHQFIAEHHGTTVVRYFHRVASDKQPQIASGRHDREVSEADFRYAGPKPRTRESAVLMMCDSVEGAVRALAEPTVGRIENTVEQIVADRLSDGQFDECDITLREIRLVEESLVKSLCSIYHGRVAYPKPAKAQAEQEPERQRVSV